MRKDFWYVLVLHFLIMYLLTLLVEDLVRLPYLRVVILVCLNTIVMQMRFVAIQTLLNFGIMKVNSGHHSGHPNRNIRYYDSEGNDDDIGEGGEPILGELSYPNKSSAVLRVKSVECSA